MSRALLVLICISVLVTGCGSNTATAPTPSASPTVPVAFSGRVFDYRTEAPQSSANVSILPTMQFPEFLRATTDAEGRYTLTVPKTGIYGISVNGGSTGSLYVTGPAFRGDLFIDTGSCVSRYGLVIDSQTLQPVSGGKVTIGPGTEIGACATSGSDGWYRCDLGCPSRVVPNNTTVFSVSHPDYRNWSQFTGRGIGLVLRTDVALEHR
jgi:hypothetical protein